MTVSNCIFCHDGVKLYFLLWWCQIVFLLWWCQIVFFVMMVSNCLFVMMVSSCLFLRWWCQIVIGVILSYGQKKYKKKQTWWLNFYLVHCSRWWYKEWRFQLSDSVLFDVDRIIIWPSAFNAREIHMLLKFSCSAFLARSIHLLLYSYNFQLIFAWRRQPCISDYRQGKKEK